MWVEKQGVLGALSGASTETGSSVRSAERRGGTQKAIRKFVQELRREAEIWIWLARGLR